MRGRPCDPSQQYVTMYCTHHKLRNTYAVKQRHSQVHAVRVESESTYAKFRGVRVLVTRDQIHKHQNKKICNLMAQKNSSTLYVCKNIKENMRTHKNFLHHKTHVQQVHFAVEKARTATGSLSQSVGVVSYL